jgi:hypothetical protein
VKGKVIEIGKVKFNAVYLRSVSEKKACKDYSHLERSKVVNAWKQANGLTVRNNKKPKSPKKVVVESTENKD